MTSLLLFAKCMGKLLKKLSTKEREQLQEVLVLIISDDASSLDIKKLKGTDDIYRARTGDIRIIFQKRSGEIFVLEVSRRDESTYKDY